VINRMHRVEHHRSGIPGIEAMTLYSNHAFPRHSHDQYGIGIMTSGAQRSWSVIGQVESEAGDDGMPVDGSARGWRILYLDPALVAREIADEATEKELIARPVARDSHLAGRSPGCSRSWRSPRRTALRRRRTFCVVSCTSFIGTGYMAHPLLVRRRRC
jgi:hypothetical protein